MQEGASKLTWTYDSYNSISYGNTSNYEYNMDSHMHVGYVEQYARVIINYTSSVSHHIPDMYVTEVCVFA